MLGGRDVKLRSVSRLRLKATWHARVVVEDLSELWRRTRAVMGDRKGVPVAIFSTRASTSLVSNSQSGCQVSVRTNKEATRSFFSRSGGKNGSRAIKRPRLQAEERIRQGNSLTINCASCLKTA